MQRAIALYSMGSDCKLLFLGGDGWREVSNSEQQETSLFYILKNHFFKDMCEFSSGTM